MFAVIAPLAARPVAAPRRATTHRAVTRAAADDKFASAPAPSLDAPAPAMKAKDAKRAAKKAEKLAKKAAASAAPLQKPKRRKAKTGQKKVDLPPTEAELRAPAKYDALVAEAFAANCGCAISLQAARAEAAKAKKKGKGALNAAKSAARLFS